MTPLRLCHAAASFLQLATVRQCLPRYRTPRGEWIFELQHTVGLGVAPLLQASFLSHCTSTSESTFSFCWLCGVRECGTTDHPQPTSAARPLSCSAPSLRTAPTQPNYQPFLQQPHTPHDVCQSARPPRPLAPVAVDRSGEHPLQPHLLEHPREIRWGCRSCNEVIVRMDDGDESRRGELNGACTLILMTFWLMQLALTLHTQSTRTRLSQSSQEVMEDTAATLSPSPSSPSASSEITCECLLGDGAEEKEGVGGGGAR